MDEGKDFRTEWRTKRKKEDGLEMKEEGKRRKRIYQHVEGIRTDSVECRGKGKTREEGERGKVQE